MKHSIFILGGVDNKFPHHENEIAQSEAATGKKFVNYWLHTEHLLVDGKKMSKSLGNFYTLRELLSMGLNPKAIRYVFINSNYHQQLNFSIDAVRDAEKTIGGLQNFIDRLQLISIDKPNDSIRVYVDEALSGFTESMDMDLNVPNAMKSVFEFVKKVNALIDAGELGVSGAREALDFLRKINSVIAVLDFEEKFFELTPEQQELINERRKARLAKDWKKSDSLRDELRAQGIEVIDAKDGSMITRPIKK